jgi:hypothetical protein
VTVTDPAGGAGGAPAPLLVAAQRSSSPLLVAAQSPSYYLILDPSRTSEFTLNREYKDPSSKENTAREKMGNI